MQHAPSMYKRSKSTAITKNVKALTPVVLLLDVLMDFLKNNVHDQLQVDLHFHCLGVFHRILCYQRHFTLRLEGFEWAQLWTALFRIVRFVSREQWLQRPSVLALCERVRSKGLRGGPRRHGLAMERM